MPTPLAPGADRTLTSSIHLPPLVCEIGAATSTVTRGPSVLFLNQSPQALPVLARASASSPRSIDIPDSIPRFSAFPHSFLLRTFDITQPSFAFLPATYIPSFPPPKRDSADLTPAIPPSLGSLSPLLIPILIVLPTTLTICPLHPLQLPLALALAPLHLVPPSPLSLPPLTTYMHTDTRISHAENDNEMRGRMRGRGAGGVSVQGHRMRRAELGAGEGASAHRDARCGGHFSPSRTWCAWHHRRRLTPCRGEDVVLNANDSVRDGAAMAMECMDVRVSNRAAGRARRVWDGDGDRRGDARCSGDPPAGGRVARRISFFLTYTGDASSAMRARCDGNARISGQARARPVAVFRAVNVVRVCASDPTSSSILLPLSLGLRTASFSRIRQLAQKPHEPYDVTDIIEPEWRGGVDIEAVLMRSNSGFPMPGPP
ncbi:hypothetical protein B0H19DRAFT_1081582 [Mycena capillaripes]|nr:hypothetical protein B0H19DRAFT_1081582 [Mycena capillaripes]